MNVKAALDKWFYKQIAIVALLFKQNDIAIEYWERIYSLSPNDPKVLAALAHLKAARGDRAEAIALINQALALDARQPANWFNLGFLLQQGEAHDDAIAAFRRALEIDEKLDRAWYGLALSLISQEKVAEAVQCLKRNTELQPMSPYGWYQLAHAYLRLGQREKAESVIHQLAKFEPKVALRLERETGIKSGVKLPF